MTQVRPVKPREDRQAPTYRMFVVRVARTRRLGPSFTRVSFTGDCLREFGAGGDDQRIKLMLPRPGRTVADVPDGESWYPTWQGMPDEVRPTMRTYTVRAHRPEAAELDIDFVLHGVDDGHGGPASTWAAMAEPGDTVALLGPDRVGGGRMWGCEWNPPAQAKSFLLAGDETAVPAVASIVESLSRDARGIVCVEVPAAGDIQWWNPPEGVEVRWSIRQHAASPHGTLLETAVTSALDELCHVRHPTDEELDDPVTSSNLLWDVPEQRGPVDAASGELYGWIAGESAVIKRLRRLMVNGFGLPKSAVAFMGYWRR